MELRKLVARGWLAVDRVRWAWASAPAPLRFVVLLLPLLTLPAATSWMVCVDASTFGGQGEASTLSEPLRALLLAIGTVLAGAVALVLTVLQFSLHVNAERLPFALFSRFSGDGRTLLYLLGSFLSGLAVAVLSLYSGSAASSVAIVAASWFIVLEVALLLLALRRAVALINPFGQLQLLVSRARESQATWLRRFHRVEPLIEVPGGPGARPGGQGLAGRDLDLKRAVFFRLHNRWDSSTSSAINDALAIFRSHARRGDLEAARAALNAAEMVNRSYVAAKGATFFADHPFFPAGEFKDPVVGLSLEGLRLSASSAIARRAESEMEMIFQSLERLGGVYLQIQYPGPLDSPYDAIVAGGYLCQAVKDSVAFQSADILMEGARSIGRLARAAVGEERSAVARSLVATLKHVAVTGLTGEAFRPATRTAVEELSLLIRALLDSREENVAGALRDASAALFAVGRLVVSVPSTSVLNEQALMQAHFSAPAPGAFLAWLIKRANETHRASENELGASLFASHLTQWSEELLRGIRDLLRDTLGRGSSLNFDLVSWACDTAACMNLVSLSPACEESDRDELRRSAKWLIGALTFFPDTEDGTYRIERARLPDCIFGAAYRAVKWGLVGFSEYAAEILVRTGQRAARFENMGFLSAAAMTAAALLAAADKSKLTLAAASGAIHRYFTPAARLAPGALARALEALELSGNGEIDGVEPYSRMMGALRELDKSVVTRHLAELQGLLRKNLGGAISPSPRPEPRNPE